MLQIRRIGHRSAVALSSPMLKITADVPVSDIIIGLTLEPNYYVIAGQIPGQFGLFYRSEVTKDQSGCNQFGP